ncbi:MAG: aldo/keto reductase [Firmicutes bacterium]|nr:aldo/keto reductase [Bacillota bacterium]
MRYNLLGNTGIKVSQLCFGVLPMGPLQVNISPDDGGELLLAAMENGVNFFDTAQSYGTYAHLAKALRHYPERVVLASKSTAADYAGMRRAIEEALEQLGVDCIDIFHLHAARVGRDLLTQRAGAWQCLLDYRQKGYIRAAGVSSHNAQLIEDLAENPDVDVLFPLINKTGLGILSGGREDMCRAIAKAAAAGKGVYAMKALGGGALLSDYRQAMDFVCGLPGVASVAVGMVRVSELAFNLRYFNGQTIEEEELSHLKNGKRWVLMQALCKNCGTCVQVCPNHALRLGPECCQVDEAKCILCGYCAPVCPQFAIRLG